LVELSEITTLARHLEKCRAVTLQMLELAPAAQLDWRPAEDWRSLGEQFLHISQVEAYYIDGLFDRQWRFAAFKPPAEPPGKELLLERLELTHARTIEILQTLDDDWLADYVDVPGVPVLWPLRSWLWQLVEHEIHHKAQLALYLRQLGLAVPFWAFPLPPGVRPDQWAASRE
jgi:uncharacterized damage-inducible protein DinB